MCAFESPTIQADHAHRERAKRRNSAIRVLQSAEYVLEAKRIGSESWHERTERERETIGCTTQTVNVRSAPMPPSRAATPSADSTQSGHTLEADVMRE
ncbi:hypothetical protein [Candidatus Poriferisodalis sp.]|uniref:hypothetical protein n=1 Tax=Candidatus Poriferisodalis sp. TaxID=3101277 RepID=UPI003B52F4D4